MKIIYHRDTGRLGVCLSAFLVAFSVTSAPPAEIDLGEYSFRITTSSPEAQRVFDRGLNWTYGFAHHAAEREYRRAAAADPECAMAYWGIAMVNGPHINFPFVPEPRAETAYEALKRAENLARRAGSLEQALIQALSKRYALPQPEDRSQLDRAYAEEMAKVWREFPDNPDVGALYAEAEMNLHPWDLWKPNGEPQPWTPLIVATLEKVLEMNPDHPGANHYYIHAIEASRTPEKALATARRLEKLVPGSSHLVHMPSHIYARVGLWSDAARANSEAMRVDAAYREAYPRPGFYALYMAHNTHFMAFTSMMRGRSEEAVRLAREMVATIPADFVRDYPGVVDGFTVFVPEVLMRFGKWEEILREPAPPQGLPLGRTKWHFTRATALTVLGRKQEAAAEREAFLKAASAVPEDAAFGNNSSRDLVEIAKLVLEGEMAAQDGNFSAAIPKLEDAVNREDQLRYDEPPDWIQPVRHTLGAVLLRAGQPKEAEAVYRADLERLPENGWALLGLSEALQQQGRGEESAAAKERFSRAWASADVQPKTTCYCQEAPSASPAKPLNPAGRQQGNPRSVVQPPGN